MLEKFGANVLKRSFSYSIFQLCSLSESFYFEYEIDSNVSH